MTPSAERGLWLPDPAQRANLAAFVERARRLDDAAVIRLRRRSQDVLVAWVATGFDVLASRVVAGTVRPPDISAGADELSRGLAAPDPSGYVDPGFPMDSGWRGALPPESGFVHIDDVPARAVLDLAQRGAEVSKEQGAHGPPVSLLDQEVIQVSAAGVSGRCADALCIRFDGNGFCRLTSRRRDRAGPDGRCMAARRRTVRLGVLPPRATAAV